VTIEMRLSSICQAPKESKQHSSIAIADRLERKYTLPI